MCVCLVLFISNEKCLLANLNDGSPIFKTEKENGNKFSFYLYNTFPSTTIAILNTMKSLSEYYGWFSGQNWFLAKKDHNRNVCAKYLLRNAPKYYLFGFCVVPENGFYTQTHYISNNYFLFSREKSPLFKSTVEHHIL